MQVVVLDTAVAAIFERECYTYNPYDPSFKLPKHLKHMKHLKAHSPKIQAAVRACVSDEHYVATVLAAYGLDDEVSLH